MDAYRTVFPEADSSACFRAYLGLGGMPYLQQLHYDPQLCQEYLRNLFDTIELKDILQPGNPRNSEILERLLTYVLANTGTQFSARSLSRFLKSEGGNVSIDTILKYLHLGMDAFLCYRVPREDLAGRRLLTVDEKYYVADHGLRAAVVGQNATEDIQLVLENVVCIELLRRGYKLSVGDNAGREIDFVAIKADTRLYVQVTYLLASADTIEREFSAFRGLPDGYPRFLVSMDELDMSREGVHHYNIREFLLSREWG